MKAISQFRCLGMSRMRSSRQDWWVCLLCSRAFQTVLALWWTPNVNTFRSFMNGTRQTPCPRGPRPFATPGERGPSSRCEFWGGGGGRGDLENRLKGLLGLRWTVGLKQVNL